MHFTGGASRPVQVPGSPAPFPRFQYAHGSLFFAAQRNTTTKPPKRVEGVSAHPSPLSTSPDGTPPLWGCPPQAVPSRGTESVWRRSAAEALPDRSASFFAALATPVFPGALPFQPGARRHSTAVRLGLTPERFNLTTERLSLTAVNLDLTVVRCDLTVERFNLTVERLSLTAVNLDPTAVRFDLIAERFNLTMERPSLGFSRALERVHAHAAYGTAIPGQSGLGFLARRQRQPFDEVVRNRLARREGNAGLCRL